MSRGSFSNRTGLSVLVAAALLAVSVSGYAANFGTDGAQACEPLYNSDRANLAVNTNGIKNNSPSNYVPVICPVHRSNARSTAVANITASVQKQSSSAFTLTCIGFSIDQAGNVVSTSPQGILVQPFNGQMAIGSLTPAFWGTFSLFCSVPPGDRIVGALLSEN